MYVYHSHPYCGSLNGALLCELWPCIGTGGIYTHMNFGLIWVLVGCIPT